MDPDLVEAIDKKAGTGNRSQFIIDAVTEKLHLPPAKRKVAARTEVTPIPKGKGR